MRASLKNSVFPVLAAWALFLAPAADAASLYSAAQASAGADVYSQSCAMCHGDQLQGSMGPALAGANFTSAGNTVGDIYGVISQQMPENAPGSLSAAQDTDVLAYILSKNGYAAGSSALNPADKATAATAITAQGK